MRRCAIIFAVLIALHAPNVRAQSTDNDNAETLAYSISLGLGSARTVETDLFRKRFDPSLGLLFGVGVKKSMFEVSGSFDYNFFVSANVQQPYDINVLMLFLNLKVSPLTGTVRPYVTGGGGLYSTWVVDLELDENVIGYHVGGGLEFVVDRVRHIFLEGRWVQGRTRKTEAKANTEIIPVRLGISWTL